MLCHIKRDITSLLSHISCVTQIGPMGGVSVWHWAIFLVWLGCLIWFLNSTAKMLRAAGLSAAWAALALVPIVGAAIVQNMIAKRLAG